jgi:hypothetical protein
MQLTEPDRLKKAFACVLAQKAGQIPEFLSLEPDGATRQAATLI